MHSISACEVASLSISTLDASKGNFRKLRSSSRAEFDPQRTQGVLVVPVVCPGNELAVAHQYSTDRHFAQVEGLLSLEKCLSHKYDVGIFRFGLWFGGCHIPVPLIRLGAQLSLYTEQTQPSRRNKRIPSMSVTPADDGGRQTREVASATCRQFQSRVAQ
eukprot:scaffold1042_cov401-Prasinococcus_capsulatus_cf.AAC.21